MWRIQDSDTSRSGRSRGLMLLACVSLAALLVSSAPTALGARASASVTLTWQMWSSSAADTNAWNHVAALVTKQYPDIQIKTQFTGGSYYTKLQAEVAAGTLPCLIGMLGSPANPVVAPAFLPLDSLMKQRHFDMSGENAGMLKAMRWQGKQVALPYDLGSFAILYNHKMFRAHNLADPQPGWTLATFLKDAQILTGEGKYALAGTNQFWMVEPFAFDFGSTVVDAAGKYAFTSPEMTRAITWYADLDRKYHVMHPVSTSPTFSAEGVWESGDAAMLVDGPWEILSAKSAGLTDIGAVPLPVGPTGRSITYLGGSGVGIAKTCTNVDAAWKALTVIVGAPGEDYLASVGRIWPAHLASQKYAAQSWPPGVLAGYQAADKTALPGPLIRAEAQTAFANYSAEVFNGSGGSVGDLLARVQQAATAAAQ